MATTDCKANAVSLFQRLFAQTDPFGPLPIMHFASGLFFPLVVGVLTLSGHIYIYSAPTSSTRMKLQNRSGF